ncbi:MAG: phosphoribosylamine--glycine ligase [Ferruginibacter sp.]|nr:phosphoribosylamine--glycine ligase [Ferruginibacter sp.]
MNILLIGSGGRENALAWKLTQSKNCSSLYIAPGNAGTANFGTNLPIAVNDFELLAKTCVENNVDMMVVGPEEPLVNGIYDYFKTNELTKHIHVIGPSKMAAQLEGSKAFAKTFMQRHNIPTAKYAEFTEENYEAGVAYIQNHTLPIVLKADGLAAGKGVVICTSIIEALSEFDLMLNRAKFGEAGKKVVIEEFLTGIELSIFALTDGNNYLLLPEAKDYKRIGEGDTGLNTGGMGAVSPLPFVTQDFLYKIEEQIVKPTIEGFKKENFDYKGFVFFGLINVEGEPKVIEYNCRMGDPETETVIPRIDNDLVDLLLATSQQRLHEKNIQINAQAVATVIAVSGGYPGDYEKGKSIEGLNNSIGDNTLIFHCGTKQQDMLTVTNGGRVIAATSFGSTIQEAVEQSVYALEQIHFEGMYFRTDIGYEFKD